MFVRSGYYKGAAFKFVLDIPLIYPEEGPVVRFSSQIFHPLVDPRTGELDLSSHYQSPQHAHYIVLVLAYIKRVLYRTDDWKKSQHILNKDAFTLYDTDKDKFQEKCQMSVEMSLKKINVTTEQDSSFVITESKPQHSLVVRKIFAAFLDYFKHQESEDSKPQFNYLQLFGTCIKRMQ